MSSPPTEDVGRGGASPAVTLGESALQALRRTPQRIPWPEVAAPRLKADGGGGEMSSKQTLVCGWPRWPTTLRAAARSVSERRLLDSAGPLSLAAAFASHVAVALCKGTQK